MVDADDAGIARLAIHFENTIRDIVSGTWSHLPSGQKLKECLRTQNLHDWKLRQKDIKGVPSFAVYDSDVKGMWPDGFAIKSTVYELRGKVFIASYSDYNVVLLSKQKVKVAFELLFLIFFVCRCCAHWLLSSSRKERACSHLCVRFLMSILVSWASPWMFPNQRRNAGNQ